MKYIKIIFHVLTCDSFKNPQYEKISIIRFNRNNLDNRNKITKNIDESKIHLVLLTKRKHTLSFIRNNINAV